MNILFFGGTSFVSNNLIDCLAKRHDVTNISRRRIKNIKNIYLDLKNKKTYRNLNKIKNKDIDILFFFSSYVPLKESNSSWHDCSDINVYSCIEILKYIKFKVKKIIISSSTSIYGQQNKVELQENNFLNPDTGYAMSKFCQEHIFRIFCKERNIKFLALRFGYVYSYKMNQSRLIIKIFKKFKNNEDIQIYNEDKINLNLIHINDLSKITMKLMNKHQGIFNICSNKFITLKSYISVLQKVFPDFKGRIYKFNDQKQKKMNSYSTIKMRKHVKNIKLITLHEEVIKMKFLI